MAKLNRRALATRHVWSREDQLFVAHGVNWFGLARWPSYSRLPWEPPPAWPSRHALAEMRECWQQHAEALLVEFAGDRPLWGSLVFEQRVNPVESIEQVGCAARRRERWRRGDAGETTTTTTNNTPQE